MTFAFVSNLIVQLLYYRPPQATGFPIAKFAAKLAVGYSLDQIANDITQKTPASFEPSIDYVVTKIPKFAFEKFAGTKAELTTQMKSVGEVRVGLL